MPTTLFALVPVRFSWSIPTRVSRATTGTNALLRWYSRSGRSYCPCTLDYRLHLRLFRHIHNMKLSML